LPKGDVQKNRQFLRELAKEIQQDYANAGINKSIEEFESLGVRALLWVYYIVKTSPVIESKQIPGSSGSRPTCLKIWSQQMSLKVKLIQNGQSKK